MGRVFNDMGKARLGDEFIEEAAKFGMESWDELWERYKGDLNSFNYTIGWLYAARGFLPSSYQMQERYWMMGYRDRSERD
jgi:hypothetical protein